ncbi:hypothetical protein [Propylenella binzhouense]|uniref:Uncharacterized protein n=1 Tax=Propylenella binzhouense TaxID=2555902 RepID=A0A964T643_9HYPH|nr:hypothetical protein [Propylenella binzhouense]MYZ48102.1 hypothetical protein [Propylenella binzhouense]
MKFKVSRASAGEERAYLPPVPGALRVDAATGFQHWEIELMTLEDLARLVETVGCDLVVGEGTITVLDGRID